MKSLRLAALCCAAVLLAASCSRSSNSSSSSSNATSTSASSSAAADTALASGGFGDLTKVCRPGDAKGATAPGVTDTDIKVGTVTDKGFEQVQGLNKEMYDAGVAFAAWCNEHGGILGRKLVIDDLDAKVLQYGDRLKDACNTNKDFALVGGGSALDDDPSTADNPQGVRIGCGLPNIPAYVVSAGARVAKLQVQPVPNPVYQLGTGAYAAMEKAHPGSLAAYGILYSADLASIKTVHDQDVEGIGLLGGKVIYEGNYSIIGGNDWTSYVADMKAKGVKMLEYVGQPTDLEQLQQAMDTAGFYPDVTILTTNFYDSKYLQEGGAAAKNTWIRGSFTPFELASQNKATQDYLDLMKQYNPSGKVALLGAQATSAFLLFAKAATDCGSNLTQQCLIDKASAVHEWTGGGLHAVDDPGANAPSSCFVLLKVDTDKFTVDTAATAANKGIFNCSPSNVSQLKNDYGVPRG